MAYKSFKHAHISWRVFSVLRALVGGAAAAALLAGGGGAAFAQTPPTYTPPVFTPGTSIVQTKHNLSSAGLTTQVNSFSGTTEVCVFCHTPHGSDTAAAVPLWNRQLNHGQTYQTYDTLGTSSLNGGVLPVGSVSIACLSCHDGTQAMNLMLNQPGGGWGNTGAMTNGGSNGNQTAALAAGTWTGCDNLGASCDATDIVWIGTDLRNDHPVGVEYCGGGVAGGGGSTVTGACKNPDFKMPVSKTVNGNQVFWVDTAAGTTGVREKTDIQLYTRDFTTVGGTPVEPSVECASCHDPHTAAQPTFLRVSNDQSGVCLSCHVK